jgi:hypothetical protein
MKTTLFAAVMALAAGTALAHNCPNEMKAIDAKLATNPKLSDGDAAKVKQLRADGEVAHKAGKHDDSMKPEAKSSEFGRWRPVARLCRARCGTRRRARRRSRQGYARLIRFTRGKAWASVVWGPTVIARHQRLRRGAAVVCRQIAGAGAGRAGRECIDASAWRAGCGRLGTNC